MGTLELSRRAALLAAAGFVLASNQASAKPIAIKVFKDPSCGCCTAWAFKLKQAGFEVTIDEAADMSAIKARYKVPDDLTSCHTGVVGTYAFEGHIPPADIKRFLKGKPKSKGLAVPGMPVNSPGMELKGEANEAYTVWEYYASGSRKAFVKHS
jgi:hypothetical protein